MTLFSLKHQQLLQSLIHCKSITPVDDGALMLLKTYLSQFGFQSTLQSFGNGPEEVLNLYSNIQLNDDGKSFCFAGHTDVVPPGDISKWQCDPFAATIKNDILYGRGAVDMKSAIVCFIAAVEEYLKTSGALGSISILLTADEEGPATNGTNPMIHWLYDNGVKIDYCLVGEPVSIQMVGDNIKIGARGSANFILKIHGKQGHVAYTHMTKNPVRAMNKILTDLHAYDFSYTNTIFDKTSVEITKIHCDSGAENVVPNLVEVRFNFRYGDDYDYEKLKVVVKNIVENHTNEYEIQSRTSGNAALWLNEQSNFIETVKRAIQCVTGIKSNASTYGGTSDARFIRSFCEVIEVGLIGDTAHQVDEFVTLNDLETLTKIYFEILKNIKH